MAHFELPSLRISAFIAHLMAQKPVFAPHRKGRQSVAFALTEDPEAVVLDYARSLGSVKKYFLPPRDELLNFNLQNGDYRAGAAEPVDSIFLGVHSYDVAAVHRLDYNFSEGNPERNYLTRRQGAVFVGVAFRPDRWHFSGSVSIEPHDPAGCDLFLVPAEDGYILEVLTPVGEQLLQGFDLSEHSGPPQLQARFDQHIYVPQTRLGAVMSASYDNPVWEETAARCVGCGTCNLVCPTCYCFEVEDEVDVTATEGKRVRHWDGCLLREFTQVAGGEVFRASLADRHRHRVFRKFKYLSDESGLPWCVGCGRCTAYCTAGISIVEIVNRLVGDFEQNYPG